MSGCRSDLHGGQAQQLLLFGVSQLYLFSCNVCINAAFVVVCPTLP